MFFSYFLLVTSLTIFRIIFIIYNIKNNQFDLLLLIKTFGLGIRFDLAIATYAVFPFILFLWIPGLNILKNNTVSKNDPKFMDLIEILNDNFKSLNLLGMMTKFLFKEKISFDEIKDLIKWLHDNKKIKQYSLFFFSLIVLIRRFYVQLLERALIILVN